MRKLYVQIGKVRFRPTLKIRDTGFCLNHWQRLGRAGSGTAFYGAQSVRKAPVEKAIKEYFEYLRRCGAYEVWMEDSHASRHV